MLATSSVIPIVVVYHPTSLACSSEGERWPRVRHAALAMSAPPTAVINTTSQGGTSEHEQPECHQREAEIGVALEPQPRRALPE
jgi:hypothetical protein